MNEQNCVTIKLYLWSPEFELHIIFVCYKIVFFFWFFFFTHLRTSNTILTSELYKSRTAAMFGPWAEACWSWIKLSIKHEGRTCLFSDPEKVTQKDDLPQPFPRKFFDDVAWQMGGVNQTWRGKFREEKTKLRNGVKRSNELADADSDAADWSMGQNIFKNKLSGRNKWNHRLWYYPWKYGVS